MSNIDKKIKSLFEVVQTQKDEVAKAEKEARSSWKTNCSLPYSEDGRNVNLNIQTLSKEKVKDAVVFLLQQKEFSNKAEDFLGLGLTNAYAGFPFEDWMSDCKKRIVMLSMKTKKDTLAELEKRLNDIVSPEEKRLMELEAIEKSLKN